ncbi:endoglucanase [Phenylobacterium sp.]|jgi:tetratricopeptide (TPR) repeat protein|uniref:tetratricopeptide repeat protein n=1 Tax=Phenylobacterium sp. TaxID=1871053 RepID=UPI002E30FE27|nr:endoglucanase [Phenylobacterium sp.]HEX3364323.1 endoglucanase [Phenylobacterium sp.]
MNLRQTLRAGVAAIAVASVVAPAGAATSSIDVRVAQSDGFSRVEFRGAPDAKVKKDGQVLVFTFPRDADPDIARLHTAPPKWIKTAEKKHIGGHLQLSITLTDDADYKVGSADGATFVNVFQKAPPTAAELAAAKAAIPEPQRPNPVPAGGVVHMAASVNNAQVQFGFTWANPAGAAVFRRGDAIWVVFDAPAVIDVGHSPKGLVQYSAISSMKGGDYSAVRIEAAHGVPVFATSIGNTWTIALGPGDEGSPSVVRLSRDEAEGPATLKAAVAGATKIVQMADPQAGDTLDVVTALGPAKGLPSRRDYVQMAVLPSIQGLAIESHIDDLEVARDGDIVRIGRKVGLALSPSFATQEDARLTVDAPKPAAMPALIDADWSRTGPKGFLDRYQHLLSAATVESANKDKAAPVGARMALARFLVGSELSFEAIGVLNDTARANPQLMDNPEFRGLRGVARVMARRYKEADADFSAPVLAEDRSSALWKSYIASKLAQWPEARAQFVKGAEAYNMFPPTWRARFARADAQAALAQGDLLSADARIHLALADKTDVYEELATRLVQARIIEQQGHKDRALRMYTAIAGAPRESLSSPALLRATQIKLEMGKATPVQAAQVFDGLRYRWRGDATELETIRALGQLYLSQGRYREALEALRSAGTRLPDLPEALQLSSDLNAAFRGLFLNGSADGLEPVQALALFYDFKELTPIGADGDLMVRKLVRRLVDVDLLDQAAELLKYQADNRLDGVPKAQVATDLAVIYLMDKKPEQAIQAINSSRTTVLPAALNAERRLVESRAWMGVGKYDTALEIIEKDTTKEGQDLRAEITWKQKDWAKAGPQFEKALGARWKDPTALSADDEGKLLRAGVAYSLAGDDAALTRLSGQYKGFFDAAHNPEALRIALTGVSTNRLSVADFGRVSADNEAFTGWVAKMKDRFKTRPAPTGPTKAAAAPAAPAKPAPAKQAQAATGTAKG